ncbi:MAG: hypothetical protein GY861_07270 [bacterium]|nr:hypothetical protein [bacterium]
MSNEEFPKVDLSVIEPDNISEFRILYEGETEQMCTAYNQSIRDVLRENELVPFHLSGEQNEAGQHIWEIIGSPSTKDSLEELFPKIHEMAEEKYVL